MHLLIEGSGGVHGGGAGAEGEVGGASVAVFALPPAEGGEEVGKERGVGDGEAGVEDLFGALKVEDEEEAGEDLLEGEDGSYLLRRKRERWEARDAFSLFSNLLCSSLTSRSRSLSLSLSVCVYVYVSSRIKSQNTTIVFTNKNKEDNKRPRDKSNKACKLEVAG